MLNFKTMRMSLEEGEVSEANGAVVFMKGDVEIKASILNLKQRLQLLRDDWTAIPF